MPRVAKGAAMKSRPVALTLFALLAAAAAVVFLAIAIDAGIYAPGAHDGGRQERALAPLAQAVPAHFRHDVTPSILLRKFYSVVAFGIVGLLCAPLVPKARRVLACGLLVAGFSTIIEIAQRLTVSHESNLFSAFDIGCGALGGVLGAMVWNLVSRKATISGNS
ncbi:MAG: hypothetical protein NVS3B28_30600 [Candidatus Velthaea sp.]